MTTYGEFERGDPIHVGLLCSVYTAHRVGAKGGRDRYVVKICSAGGTLVSGGDDARRDFRNQAGVQKAVSLRAPKRWSVIHDIGEVADGTYLITDRFDRSIQWIVDGRLRVDSNDLVHLSRGVIRSLIDLREECKRGHGNLKPSNILLTRPQIRRSRIVLADPSPEAPSQTRREEHDLYQLGTIVFELISSRSYRSLGDWPIEDSPVWSRLGAAGEKWRAICNDLLCPDQNEAITDLNAALNRLRKDFGREKSTGVKAVAAMAIIVLMLGAAAFGWWSMRTTTEELLAQHVEQIEKVEDNAPQEIRNLLADHAKRLRALDSRSSISDSEALLSAISSTLIREWQRNEIHRECFENDWRDRLAARDGFDIEGLTHEIQAKRFQSKTISLPDETTLVVCSACEVSEYQTYANPKRAELDRLTQTVTSQLDSQTDPAGLKPILPTVAARQATEGDVPWESLSAYDTAIAQLNQLSQFLQRVQSLDIDWTCLIAKELGGTIGPSAINGLGSIDQTQLSQYEIRKVQLPDGSDIAICDACEAERFAQVHDRFDARFSELSDKIQRQVENLPIRSELSSWLPTRPNAALPGTKPDWESLESFADVNQELERVSNWLASIGDRDLDWDCITSKELNGATGSDALNRLVALTGDDLDSYRVIPYDTNAARWNPIAQELTTIKQQVDPGELKLDPGSDEDERKSLSARVGLLEQEAAGIRTCASCWDTETKDLENKVASLGLEVRKFRERLAAAPPTNGVTETGGIVERRRVAVERVNTKLSTVQSTITSSNMLSGLSWLPQAIAGRADTRTIQQSENPDADANEIVEKFNAVEQAAVGLATSFNLNPNGGSLPTGSWRVADVDDFRSERQSTISDAWNNQSNSITNLDQLAAFLNSQSKQNTDRKTELDSIFERRETVRDLLSRNTVPTEEMRDSVSSWQSDVESDSSWVQGAVQTTLAGADLYLNTLNSSSTSDLWNTVHSNDVSNATAWAAWQRLQDLNAIPDAANVDSLDELAPLVETRKALEGRLDAQQDLTADQRTTLQSLLPDNGATLWTDYVRQQVFGAQTSIADWNSSHQQRLTSALSKRGDFGVSMNNADLAHDIRFDMMLVEMKGTIDEDVIDQKLDGWATELENLSDVQGASELAAELRRIRSESRNSGGGSIRIVDGQQVGPERVGWTRTEDQSNSGRILFRSPRSGSSLEIAFRPLTPANGRTTFLSETEASIAICNEAVVNGSNSGGERADLATDVVTRLGRVDDDSWSGPRGWRVETRGQVQELVIGRPQGQSRGWLSPAIFAGLIDIQAGAAEPFANNPPIPDRNNPIQQVSAAESGALANLLGCRLPTGSEWQAASQISGAEDILSLRPNLRDEAWQIQRDHLVAAEQEKQANVLAFWPDFGSFVPSGLDVPTQQTASIWNDSLTNHAQNPQQPYQDGVLYFSDVDQGVGTGQSPFSHLVGNVAEYVLQSADALPDDATLSTVTDVYRRLLPQGGNPVVGVIGGSALSAPEIPLTQFEPVERGRIFGNRFADVGFRLAFEAQTESGERIALLPRVQTAIADQPFATGVE